MGILVPFRILSLIAVATNHPAATRRVVGLKVQTDNNSGKNTGRSGKGRSGKGRSGKGRSGKGRSVKGRSVKGRSGKGRSGRVKTDFVLSDRATAIKQIMMAECVVSLSYEVCQGHIDQICYTRPTSCEGLETLLSAWGQVKALIRTSAPRPPPLYDPLAPSRRRKSPSFGTPMEKAGSKGLYYECTGILEDRKWCDSYSHDACFERNLCNRLEDVVNKGWPRVRSAAFCRKDIVNGGGFELGGCVPEVTVGGFTHSAYG